MQHNCAFSTGTNALALFSDDAGLKQHPMYREAKAGDPVAALHLVTDLAVAWLFDNEHLFALGAIYVAPPAKEASGDNAIAQTLAAVCAHVMVWLNAGRNPALLPDLKDTRLIKERFGYDFLKIFGIEPDALTANEAHYLVGFRSIDEIRDRFAKARQEIDRRLRAKGISRSRVFEKGPQVHPDLSKPDTT
jgi:hypothetical protein